MSKNGILSVLGVLALLASCGPKNSYDADWSSRSMAQWSTRVKSNSLEAFKRSSNKTAPTMAGSSMNDIVSEPLDPLFGPYPNPALMPFYCNPWKYPGIAITARDCQKYLMPTGAMKGYLISPAP